MLAKNGQKLYHVVLVFANDLTRTVKVKASSRDVAERRALKRNRGAIGVKRNAP